MRTVSAATTAAWQSGDYVGSKKPMVRATIQRLSLCMQSYGKQSYSSVPFGQANRPLELPNIKDVKWQRSVDAGVATCTLTLYNTDALPIGATPSTVGDFDKPGAYSPKRGATAFSSRWGHTKTGWRDWLVPDRIIRTYEGYGYDATRIPEEDPNLYQSGVWLIDDVTFTTDGTIQVDCRDIGRVLLDQILFPPIVPMASYPLYFTPYYSVPNPDVTSTSLVNGGIHVAFETSSNQPYIGTGSEYGHIGPDAFDNNDSSFWLSIGNASPDAGYSFEYVQGKFASAEVHGATVKVWGGGYHVYCSIFADGKWQGDSTVPYDPNNPVSAPNGSNIRYVQDGWVDANGTATFVFKTPFKNATRVRFCFTQLGNSGIGPYPYRAGVRKVTVQGKGEVTTTKPGGHHREPKTSPPGIGDYSDIVKILLAWSGFFWPQSTAAGFVTYSDGSRHIEKAPTRDPVLAGGRVWGDIEESRTAPEVAIPVSVWDKKPVMDGITYVRDILGYIFFVDETGGAVFRAPNIWSVGNWIGDGGPSAGRTTSVVTIDERQTMLSLSAKMSSRSIREKIFVGNISGQIAAMSHGFNPYPSGLRRVGGWTDQHFNTTRECQIMADLLSLRELFTYRTDKIQIAGNPAIQVDDQVRIYERISEEGYLHYVNAISMNWSIETGKYTYDLDTHWLGDTAFTNWTFNPKDLSAEAQQYLKSIGRIA